MTDTKWTRCGKCGDRYAPEHWAGGCPGCVTNAEERDFDTLKNIIAKAGKEFTVKGIQDQTRIEYVATAIRAAGYVRVGADRGKANS